MMHDIIIWIGGFGIGFWIGGLYLRYRATKIIYQMFVSHPNIEAAVREAAKDGDDANIYPTYFTEIINGSIMLYSRETSNFVCQGRTLEELAQNVKNYKNITRSTVHHDGEHFLFVDGKVKTES